LQFQRQIPSPDIQIFICNVQTLPSDIHFTRFWHCNNKQQHNDPIRSCFLYNSCRKHRIDMISTREDAAWNGLLLLCVKRPRQTFIREVTSILTTDHQATTYCVIVFFITFVANVGFDRFKRHSLYRGKHLCLNVSIVFNGLVLLELQRLYRRVIMVVLHWYNIAILNLFQISDRF
jgi:hypothetical protein